MSAPSSSRARRAIARCVPLVALLVLAACGGGGGDEAPQPTPPPSTRVLTLAPTGPANAGVLRVGQASCATGATCTSDQQVGASVTITAEPAASFVLRGWGGACAGTVGATCTVTMSDARTVSAEFGAAQAAGVQRLSLALTGTSGRVVSTPAGIDCRVVVEETSGSCAADFPAGGTVQLQATGSAGSTLGAWSGACTGNAAACSVTMSAAQSVGAQWTGGSAGIVSVFPTGTGSVRLVSTPAGIDCSRDGSRNTGTCATRLRPGTSLTISGTAQQFSVFTAVTGSCTALPCTLTSAADGERGINVGTRLDAHTLTLALAHPNANGTVRLVSAPAGIDCTITAGIFTGQCTALMQARTGIRLQVTFGAPGTWFRYVEGCPSDITCDFQLTSDRTVFLTAWIRQPAAFTATPSRVDDGDGTVRETSLANRRIDCTKRGGTITGNCTWLEQDTVRMEVEAIPAPGSVFDRWSTGPCGTSAICQRTAVGPTTTMTAIFRRN